MSATISEQRRVAVLCDGARLELSAPCAFTVYQALESVGVIVQPETQVLLDRSGREVPATSSVADLDDGALLTIVDLGLAVPTPGASRRTAGAQRADHGSAWWLLATVSILLAGGALAGLVAGAPLLAGTGYQWVVAGLTLGALATAALWIARAPADGSGAAVLVSTLALAFAAGTLSVPDAAASGHLAATVGLLCSATLGAAMAVAARDGVMRAVATTLSVVLLVYASVWGGTLLLEWGPIAAAALTLGLVAPGIRFLPTTLLPVADGYAINYKHFMSSRWTVRGAIPPDPGAVRMDAIRPTVRNAAARLRTGTVALALTAPLMTPFVLPGMFGESIAVRIGSIGVVLATVVALFLAPRHGSDPVTTWVSRGGAAIMVVGTGVVLASNASAAMLTVVAVVLLSCGILVAIMIVPLSRGMRSLAWSRVGDALESLSITLALPLALLAANVIELVREMMAG